MYGYGRLDRLGRICFYVWQAYSVASHVLRVSVWGGGEDCGGLLRVSMPEWFCFFLEGFVFLDSRWHFMGPSCGFLLTGCAIVAVFYQFLSIEATTLVVGEGAVHTVRGGKIT